MGRGRRGVRSETAETRIKEAEDNTSHDAENLDLTSTSAPLDYKDDFESVHSATQSSTKGLQPRKKQKRDEYRASIHYEADPAAAETTEFQLPKKKWFRQRAHANPFSDHRLSYPIGPDQMDWSSHFPAFVDEAPTRNNSTNAPGREEDSETATSKLVRNIEIADIGCGFGGLLFALAPLRPNTLMLGLEIRTSVTEFVENKIRVLRQQQRASADLAQSTPNEQQKDSNLTEAPVPGGYQNVSVVRTNSMKFLPNFFPRASLETIFLCFPDPHFKSRKHKARIVSSTLNSEYAYVLKEGGYVATITDVEELSEWMAERFDVHQSFERVVVDESVGDKSDLSEDETEVKWLIKMMKESTEEGRKVDRFGGKKFVGVWKRLKDPGWPDEQS